MLKRLKTKELSFARAQKSAKSTQEDVKRKGIDKVEIKFGASVKLWVQRRDFYPSPASREFEV
ncbi:MAG TPA: hypothetical protein VK937_13085 [Candidatus Limnocylindria bacterium]|nr:hypothetical protein [Candidatus Limnocylindria bacterium]